jgi:hypothetical protein
MAVVTKKHPEWIERLLAHFFSFKKIITPRLITQFDNRFKVGGITDTTNHKILSYLIKNGNN